MVGTTKAGTARTMGTAIQEDPDGTQERPTSIVLRSSQIILFRIPSLRKISRLGSRNKIGKSYHEDSVSKILSDVPTVNPSEFPSDLSGLMPSEMDSGEPFAVHSSSPSIMLSFNPSRSTSLIPS